jgi:hypothetical protein
MLISCPMGKQLSTRVLRHRMRGSADVGAQSTQRGLRFPQCDFVRIDRFNERKGRCIFTASRQLLS